MAFDELASMTRADIFNSIDSAAGESAKSIYDRFGLAQRGVSWSAFRRIVEKRRALSRHQPSAAGPRPDNPQSDPPEWDELDRMMRSAIAEKARAGNIKAYEAVAVVRASFEKRCVEIREAAELRAQRMFDDRMAERAAEQRRRQGEADAAAERQLRGEGLSDEAIRAIRDIYGVVLDDQ